MGMFIGLASNDVIGIAIAAIGTQIIMGVFVMCFYTLSAQLNNIKALRRKLLKKGHETV